MHIAQIHPENWNDVKRIYEDGIATGNATFQTEASSYDKWDQSHLPSCRLMAVENNDVLGWAALTPVSGRCVYAGVAEVSVYVTTTARGRGVGKELLAALIKESEKNNLWTLQAGIFPENTASISIYESCGFRLIGRREKIGKMNGKWRDTLLFEKRSNNIGIE
jgi:phosphinothricin acetyltransferase